MFRYMFRVIVEALRVVAAFSEGRGEGCVWRASKDLIFFIESRAERNVTSQVHRPDPRTMLQQKSTAHFHSPVYRQFYRAVYRRIHRPVYRHIHRAVYRQSTDSSTDSSTESSTDNSTESSTDQVHRPNPRMTLQHLLF